MILEITWRRGVYVCVLALSFFCRLLGKERACLHTPRYPPPPSPHTHTLHTHTHRYSSGGYTVWYYTEDVVHPQHHELIVSSLTNSPQSRIKSEGERRVWPHATPPHPRFYITHSTVTHKYTGVHSPTHHLHRTRLVKSLPEIALMRKAGEITAKAFRQVRCAGVDLLSGCILQVWPL